MSALAKGTVPFLKLALIIEGATEKLSQQPNTLTAQQLNTLKALQPNNLTA